MESIWTKDTEIQHFPTLEDDIKADVCVIGGGLSGLLTAYLLSEKGMDVCVLEAERICSGASAMTTAKVTSQHGVIYSKLEKSYGADASAAYAKINENAISEYDRIISENNIDCHWVRLPHTVYSLDGIDELTQEAAAAKRAGINCELVKETALPLPVTIALRFYEQGMFNPREFASGIAKKLKIYEKTKAQEILNSIVSTEKGSVEAQYIVVGTHYPFINTPGWYFSKLHQERSYLIALENAPELDSMYIDAASGGLSFRNYKNLLLMGGGVHRTGENDKGGFYDELKNNASKLFAGSKVVCGWSNQDCMTPDYIPYVGKYSNALPNVFVMTGFNMWGMSNSMAAAKIVTGLITNDEVIGSRLYMGQRFNLKNMSGELSRHLLTSVEGIFNGATAEKGDRICSHMGCKLTRNEDDGTWECACHGSRFDDNGNVLNGPAQKPFKIR